MEKYLIESIHKNKTFENPELGFIGINEYRSKYSYDNTVRIALTHPIKGVYKSKKKYFLKSKFDIKNITEYFDKKEKFTKFYFIKDTYNTTIYINNEILKKLKIQIGYIKCTDLFKIYIFNNDDSLIDNFAFEANEKNILELKRLMKMINSNNVSFNKTDSIFGSKSLSTEDLIEMFGKETYERERLIYDVGGYN